MKKLFCRLLTAALLMSVVLTAAMPAFAETSPYAFVYKGLLERSNHAYYYRDTDYPDYYPEDLSLLEDGFCCIYAPALFWLVQDKGEAETGEEIPEFVGYCCDLNTSILAGSKYRRIMIEECDYFTSEEKAAMVRAIVINGFWREADGKSNIEELRKAVGIPSLTTQEALSATQHAIWDYGNSGSSAVGKRYTFTYDKGAGYYEEADYETESTIHGDSVEKSYGTYPARTGMYSPTSEKNIEAVYSYLKGLAPVYSYDDKAGSIIFSDGFFVDWYSITTAEGEDTGKYQVTLSFTLEGDLDAGSEFKLDITQRGKSLYSGALPEEKGSITDDASGNTLSRTEGKKFAMSFVYDTAEEENEDAAKEMLPEVHLSLAGTQNVVHGVYFYEPEDGYTASQCLVGKACGPTPVSAEYTIPQKTLTPEPTPTPVPTRRPHHHHTPVPEIYFEEIPKTGDASLVYTAVIPALLAAAAIAKRKRK